MLSQALMATLLSSRWQLYFHAEGLQRSGKSYRLRWVNYLRLDMKHGNFRLTKTISLSFCIERLGTNLQTTLENYNAYDMLQELKSMFEEQAKQEMFETAKAFHACKQEDDESMISYLLKMKGCFDTLKCLGYPMPRELSTIVELHDMLKLTDKGLPKKATIHVVLVIRGGKIWKDKNKSRGANGKGQEKNKQAYAPKPKIPPPPKKEDLTKDLIYHQCKKEVILFYKGLDVPTRQILDSKGVIPSMKVADAKKAIQDMAGHLQKWHNGMSTRTKSTETSDGLAAIQAQLNNLGRKIKKVNEKVYAAQVRCESCGGRYRAVALGFYQRDNGNPSYQERRQTMEESLSKFMVESIKRHDENSNLIKKIRASMDAAIRNQGASIKALEIQIGQMSKVLQEKGSRSLPGSTETNTRDHVKSISTTVEADMNSIRRIKPIRYAVSNTQNRIKESAINLKMLLTKKLRTGYQIKASTNMHDSAILEDSLPPKEKDNNICFQKALADLGASVSVMPYSTFTNLGLGELAPTKLIIELADRTIKCPNGIAENVLVGIYKFVFLVDFIILDMLEDIKVPFILGRPFLSTAHAKIDVFKRKITLREKSSRRLRSNGEGEVIDEPMEDIVKTRNDDNDISNGIDEYPSFCDFDRKIHIDCAYNLQFSCMIDKIKYKGKNVVGAFIDVPIFVGNFSAVTDFAVVENMMLTVIKE
ncbi:hypothetical protein Tco_0875398 [Tanacetum coccineum]|uniref:Uncharacterized protein n=1 Tax=Tanacetum coccineum TaxID=301880 RepID=A0ABQ5BS90_9ASTR